MSHVMVGRLTHQPLVELSGRLLQMVNNNYPSKNGMSDSSLDMDLAKIQHEYELTKVFFSDSGRISIKVAMKMAVQYWLTLQQTKKTKFLSLHNGYHGNTFGAMSIYDPVNGMHFMFLGTLAQQYSVPSPTRLHSLDAVETLQQIETVLQQHHHEVATVVMELIA